MNDNVKAEERSSMDMVRDANAEIDSMRLKFEQQDAYFECVDEIQTLQEYASDFPEDDQRHIDAYKRINYLLSPEYGMGLNAKFAVKQKFSNLGRDLILYLVAPFKLLLIAVFNIIAILVVWHLIF